jgi:hypothetical protein
LQENGIPVWRRYAEKNGRVYFVMFAALGTTYDNVHDTVEKLLDTMTVPGDFTPPSLGDGWAARKSGDFDVLTDASADRDSSIKKACGFLASAREIIAKALPGKPFDASRPAAWIFQNGTKFDDRAKAALGVAPETAIYNAVDRSAMVKILGETMPGYESAICHAGAAQYVWQYFGGNAPVWCDAGLSSYAECIALSGGKGKLAPTLLSDSKSAVAAGKRRLDQWFDVVSWNEVSDNKQGTSELVAWHWFFRGGKGAQKYKKQYAGYIASLRETGDPVAARKAFDGVNFDEMLQEFKAWAADWK